MLDHGYLGGFKGETKIEMNRAFFTFKKPDEVIEPLDLTVKQSEPKTSKKKEASVSIEPSEFKKKDVPAKIEPAKEMEKHKKVHMHEPAEEKLFSKPSPAISQPPKEDMAMTKTAQQVASNNDGTLDEIEKLKRQIAEQERVRLQLELKLAEQKAVTAANEIKVAEAIAAAKAVAADPSLKMEPKVVTKKAAIVIETSSACEDSDEYYSDSYYQTDYYSDTDVDSDYDNSESSEKPKPAAKLTSAVAKAGAADSKACIAERSDAKTGVGREKSERVMKLMSKFEK